MCYLLKLSHIFQPFFTSWCFRRSKADLARDLASALGKRSAAILPGFYATRDAATEVREEVCCKRCNHEMHGDTWEYMEIYGNIL